MRTTRGPGSRRPFALAVAVVICVALAAVFVVHARGDSGGAAPAASSTTARSQLDAVMAEPHILFRNSKLGADYRRLEVVPVSDPGGPRTRTPLTCDRVDMAGGIGVCGTIHIGTFSNYEAEIFDPHFKVLRKFPLQGTANRVRVSPDGKWASITVFVYGDSYASTNFSTRAELIETHTGADVGNLEAFSVTQNGKLVGAINRNYWGVTFAPDSDHFYATQGIGSDIHLIAGLISTRTTHTLATGGECPSLSPDQTRIAYKLRSGSSPSSVRWRLHVLDLRTGKDHTLAETRSVDDQVEWLDNQTVLYAVPRAGTGSLTDVWSVPADGSGQPKLLIPWASSPSVSR